MSTARSLPHRDARPADASLIRGWVAHEPGADAVGEGWFARSLGDKDVWLVVAESGASPAVLLHYERTDDRDTLCVRAIVPPGADGLAPVASLLRDTAPRALMRLGARRVVARVAASDAAWKSEFARAGYREGGRSEDEGIRCCWWPAAPDARWQDGVAVFKRRAWTGSSTVADYAERTADRSGISALKNRLERRFVLAHARGRALDAGCGAGRFTVPLAEALPFAVGLDYSFEMLQHTGALLAAAGRPRLVVRGDAEALPFRDASFDTVVSITVLEHFPQYEAMLAEYVRVTRPGGTIVFEMPNALHPVASSGSEPPDPKSYVARLDPREAASQLSKLGLELIECMPYDFWNQNEVVMRGLGRRGRRRLQRWLHRALRVPGAAGLWARIERGLLEWLPDHVAPNILLAARKN
jgi:SAM-dependent methyltransferase